MLFGPTVDSSDAGHDDESEPAELEEQAQTDSAQTTLDAVRFSLDSHLVVVMYAWRVLAPRMHGVCTWSARYVLVWRCLGCAAA